MKNRTSERVDQVGFTLLELLISLLLTSLLTVLVYGGLQVGMSSWEKVIDRNEVNSDAFLTQRFLHRLLRTELQGELINIYGESSSVALFGLENELIFLASKSFTKGGERLWIYLNTDLNSEEAVQLQMTTAPYDSMQALELESLISELRSSEHSDLHVLSEGSVEQIEFSFLKIEQDGSNSWLPEWLFQPSLPSAIQIRFLSDNEAVKGWPNLIVIPNEYAHEIRYAR